MTATFPFAPLNLVWKDSGQYGAGYGEGFDGEEPAHGFERGVEDGGSEIDVSDLVVSSFTAPVTTAQYRARISLADADRIFRLVEFPAHGNGESDRQRPLRSVKDYAVSGAVQGAGIGTERFAICG